MCAVRQFRMIVPCKTFQSTFLRGTAHGEVAQTLDAPPKTDVNIEIPITSRTMVRLDEIEPSTCVSLVLNLRNYDDGPATGRCASDDARARSMQPIGLDQVRACDAPSADGTAIDAPSSGLKRSNLLSVHRK